MSLNIKGVKLFPIYDNFVCIFNIVTASFIRLIFSVFGNRLKKF